MKDLLKKASKFAGCEIIHAKVINPKRAHKSYMVTCYNGTKYRYDPRYGGGYTRNQQLAYDAGMYVPRTIRYEKPQRLTEWINGDLVREVWDQERPVVTMGEQVAVMNNIQHEGKYLINTDINGRNWVWTKEEKLYMVDWNHSHLVDEDRVNIVAAVSAMKRLAERKNNIHESDRNKIEWFLKGYEKYRDTDEIIKILNKYDWQWRHWHKSNGKSF